MSIAHYKDVSLSSDINSASPHRLIQMLYEGALSKLAEAKGAIERKEHEKRSQLISKAIAITLELSRSLDQEKGGELSDNLNDLYHYMRTQLMEANAENDLAKIDEVITMIVELKTAWDRIPVELRGSVN